MRRDDPGPGDSPHNRHRKRPWYKGLVGSLKRDKKAPGDDFGALTFDGDGMATLVGADGGIARAGDGAALAAALLDGGDGFRWFADGWYDGARRDLKTILFRSGAVAALVELGASVKPFHSGRDLAGVVIEHADDARGACTVTVENLHLWSPLPEHDDAIEAAKAVIRRASKLRNAVFRHFGMAFEMTPARTAYNAWRRHMTPVDFAGHTGCRYHWRPSFRLAPAARRCYHGGLVLAKRKGPYKGIIRHYDIKSAYPWAMRQGVPVGPATWQTEESYRDEFWREVPGFHCVSLVAPRPVATYFVKQLGEDGRERDVQNTPGRYCREVWMTSQEILLIEELGGVISRFHEGWIFKSGIGTPFDEWVDRCEGARTDPDPIVANYVKLFQNSLYGRFGRKADMEEVVYADDPPDDGRRWMPHVGADGIADFPAWSVRTHDEDRPGSMPHWAAWITATVRCRLIRTMVQLGPSKVLYADTDSIVTTGELATGTRYGDWQLVETYATYTVWAGKRHGGETLDGRVVVKAAGLQGTSAEVYAHLARLYPQMSRAGP